MQQAIRLLLPILGCLALLVAACSPPTAPEPTPMPPPEATPAPQPAVTPEPGVPPAEVPTPEPDPATEVERLAEPAGPVRDTLILSMGQDPDTLHPAIGLMLARAEVLFAVFTYPIVNDHRGEWMAVGVEEVPTIENGGARWVGEGDDRHLEVTFTVREGVVWHDGTPTTSADIQYAWELVMDPDFPATARTQPLKVFAIETPDDRTAVVRYMSASQAREAAENGHMGLEPEFWMEFQDQQEPLTDPEYFLPPLLSQGLWLPEHVLSDIPPDEHEGSEWARAPLGNGPYRFVQWIPDEAIRLQAVDDYFLGGPYTRNIVFRIIPDASAQLAALHAGEIDVATQVQGPNVGISPELDRLDGYEPHYIPGTAWEHIDLNLEDPILEDQDVRKALVMAMDREQIVEQLLYGNSRVAHSWVQPSIPALSWAYDEDCLVTYQHDPAGVQRLLEQAGYTRDGNGLFQRDGQPLRLRLVTTDAPLRQNVAQVLQQQLRQVGIDLELDFLPGPAFFGREGPVLRGQFQLGMYTWISTPDPDATSLYHSRSIPTAENNWVGQNFPRYANPQVDELLARGANELEIDRRQPIYCEAQQLWTDELPVIPLFQNPIVMVARDTLENFRPTPTLTPETWNIWAWFIED